MILDREFELAFELNLLAQWFNLLAQWFFLLRGKVTKSKVKTQVYGTRWKSGINWVSLHPLSKEQIDFISYEDS